MHHPSHPPFVDLGRSRPLVLLESCSHPIFLVLVPASAETIVLIPLPVLEPVGFRLLAFWGEVFGSFAALRKFASLILQWFTNPQLLK